MLEGGKQSPPLTVIEQGISDPGTKRISPPHTGRYYHRLSDWIHVLGCYGAQTVEDFGILSNYTLDRGSVGLCQERCGSSSFALQNTTCLCLRETPQINSLSPSQCDYDCSSDDDSHVNDCGGSNTYNVYSATPSHTLSSERTVNCVVLGCYEQYAQIHTNNCTEDFGSICESEESTNKTLAPDDEDFKSWSQTYKECRVEGSYLYGEVSLNEDPRVLCNKLRNFKSNTPETWLGVARQITSYINKRSPALTANDLLDTTTVMTTIESSTTETTENPTTTSESPTTIESHSTTESPITTKESPIITSQTTVATEFPTTTLITSESPTTTTKSLETTESPTTIESFTTTTESLPPPTTTESFTTITTAESFTTTTESPTTTTESFKTTTTTESPTATGSQTITESPTATTKTERPTTTTTESSRTTKENPATESPTTSMESSKIIEENFTSTEYPEISSRQTAKIPTESTTTEVSTTSKDSPTTNVTEKATSFTTLSLSTSIHKKSTTVISTNISITATSTQLTVKSTTADPVSQGPIAPASQTKTAPISQTKTGYNQTHIPPISQTKTAPISQTKSAPISQTKTMPTERAIIVVVSVTIVGILMAILGIVFKR
ncbi:mucin-2-like, partial [Saccostrea cucullata]|uniref:mucin-2-like n=1 Tax=Saccostrea cuccullata TaxID=36930 RepID=UPI002ED68424